LTTIFRWIFSTNFITYFSIKFWSFFIIFNVILGRYFLCRFLPTYTLPTPRGWKIDKFRQNWTPISGFCYIVVSTFFGPSGPPPGGPKSDHFWKKHSLFVGNDVFIGPIYGVENGGSFCKKVTNFKKFMFWGPGPPRSIFDDFDPPTAYQLFSKFGSFFNIFIRGHFWSIFDHFYPPPFLTFITLHFDHFITPLFNHL
jgi:hypothetical protein